MNRRGGTRCDLAAECHWPVVDAWIIWMSRAIVVTGPGGWGRAGPRHSDALGCAASVALPRSTPRRAPTRTAIGRRLVSGTARGRGSCAAAAVSAATCHNQTHEQRHGPFQSVSIMHAVFPPVLIVL